MPDLRLAPTPHAAARATRRLCDERGGVLFGPGATTLARLAPAILAAVGDRRPVLTPVAERLLVIEAGAAAGGALAGLAPDAGLAGALARAIGELRRGEVPADELRGAAAELGGAPGQRLALLGEALAAFEAGLLEAGALDAPAAARAAAAAVRRGAWPEGTLEIFELEGIRAVGSAEWELVAALAARARRTRVRIPFVPELAEACAPAEAFLRRVESLHELAARSDLEVELRPLDDRAPRLAALLAGVAGAGADRLPEGDGIVLAAPGAGAAGEAEAAADAVLALVERHGLAPGDILAVSAAPRRLAPALGAALRARGIPFTGGGPAAATVPVVRFVLDLLAAPAPLGRTDAARLAPSSWLGPEGSAGLERLLERAGALDGRGPAAGALRRRAEAVSAGRAARERASLAAAADRIEALEARLAPLSAAAPARLHARRLSALLVGLGLRRRAARGPVEVAARDVEALAAVEEAAEDVVRGSTIAGRGEAALPPAAFAALLRRALEARTLSAPGEPAAGAVELVGLEEAGCAGARAVLLAGCAEGAFPPAPPPEPLLRDPERIALQRCLGRKALALGGERRAEGIHAAFMAIAAAREAIAFSWAAPGPGGDGGPPAPLVLEALAAAGVAPPAGPAAEPALPASRTRRAAVRAAARLGAAGAAALAPTPLAARAEDVRVRGDAERERREAVLGGRPGPHAGGIDGAAREALEAALPAEWSPSQLEAHARCPFLAFVRTVLGLPDDGEPDLDIEVRDEGTLLHAVLERFVSARLARNAWPPSGGAADRAEARAVAAEVLARFEREGRTGDPAAWAGRREALLHRLDRIVAGEARDAGGRTPRLVEYAFGGGAQAEAIELRAGGAAVRLKGRIDRVDAGPDDLLVVDYKNSKGRGSARRLGELLRPDSFGVSSFQVPAYLMAAARALPGRRLAATFAMLRDAERLAPVELDRADPRLAAEGGAESFAAAVVERVARMRAGAFPIVSQGCARCTFGAVCRFEGVAARTAEEAG